MISKKDFLKKYNNKDKFKASKLKWIDLKSIAADYKKYRDTLKPTAQLIAESLAQVDAVHSLKIRIKDSEHLIEGCA